MDGALNADDSLPKSPSSSSKAADLGKPERWTVNNPDGPFVDGGVWANGKLLCVCENQFQAVEVCDAHNASLGKPEAEKASGKQVLRPIPQTAAQIGLLGGKQLTNQSVAEKASEEKEAVADSVKATGQKELYPDPMTPEQRRRFDKAMAEISPALEKMCKELEDCTRLSAADFAITINAR